MANFIYTVIDATSGKPLGGCEISDVINTSPCPGWPNTGNCTSGAGWTAVANAGSTTGEYTTPTVYTCPMSHIVTVSAPGYNPTTVEVETGNIDGDANVPDGGIQLTPLANVPQGNQGVGSTTLSSTATTQAAANGAISQIGSAVTNPFTGAEADIALVAIAVVIIALVVLAFWVL